MFIKYIIPAALLCLVMQACTKEQPDYPYTDILQFTLQDADGQPLKGVIENDEIILYWPPHQDKPDSISADIIVAEKASVSPASGSKVAFDAKTSYTVTAQDGSKKIYRLKPVINQPVPFIKQINPSEVLYFGELMTISGDFFIPDSNKTRVYLVGPDKKETPLIFWSPYEGIAIVGRGALWCQVPEPLKDTLPPLPYGEYQVKVVSGVRTVYHETKLTVGFGNPMIIGATPYENVKAGDVITVTGGKLIGIKGVKGKHEESETVYDFELVSYTKDELKMRVPAAAPAGTYFEFTLLSDAYGKDFVNFWLYENRITVVK